jgi:hypothetical protein
MTSSMLPVVIHLAGNDDALYRQYEKALSQATDIPAVLLKAQNITELVELCRLSQDHGGQVVLVIAPATIIQACAQSLRQQRSTVPVATTVRPGHFISLVIQATQRYVADHPGATAGQGSDGARQQMLSCVPAKLIMQS